MRPDLLALGPDDLAALANRGTVKRATRELGRYDYEITEDDDGVTVRWSDDVSCVLPAGKSLAEATCSCRATGLCRHLIRSVLACQAVVDDEDDVDVAADVGVDFWDPGAISDAALAALFPRATLTRLRSSFEREALVELVRSARPTARFLLRSATVRFLVAGDPRYTVCNCAEEAPCRHVPLAVWAFRRLPEAESGALVEVGAGLPAPADLLDEIERLLLDLTELGISGTARAWRTAVRRLATRCRDGELPWPAAALEDLAAEYDRYHGSDGRFSAARLVELVGELVVRCDAIRNDTGAVPQRLVRGSRADREIRVGAGRYLGLGVGVETRSHGVELVACLYDENAGHVVTLARDFPDPEDDAEPLPFRRLAAKSIRRRVSLAALGEGRLLIEGGRCSASHRLSLGRTKLAAHPHRGRWETLRAPVLAEDFREIAARPPASLRPRWVADDVFVCRVAGVAAAGFSEVEQAVTAAVLDQRAQTARLVHPYTSRGAEGCEALLARLQEPQLEAVAGRARLVQGNLEIAPLALVFRSGEGWDVAQPWIDGYDGGPAPAKRSLAQPRSGPEAWLDDLGSRLGKLLIAGLARVDGRGSDSWRELFANAEKLGSVLFHARLERLVGELEARRHQARPDPRPAGVAVLELAAVLEMGRELLR